MIGILVALVGVGALLYAGEWLYKTHPGRIGPEFTRKFIHITVGTFAAFWPFFISWRNVELLSSFLFIGILWSHYQKKYKSIHSVARKTWGDIFFAMSIGMVALFSQSEWVYAAALLHMSLADGFAALVGKVFGHGNRYKVFGYYKSVAGSLTFFVLSFFILLIFGMGHGLHSSWTILLWMPLVATGLENLGVAGVDNLLVPLFIAVLIS